MRTQHFADRARTVLARCRQGGGAGRLRLFSVWFVILLAMPSALPAAQAGSGTLQIAQATPADSASAENVRKSNGECLTCHSPTAPANPPRADLDLAKLKRFLVDAELFTGSNHGGVECKTCHGPGFAAFPHKDGCAPADQPVLRMPRAKGDAHRGAVRQERARDPAAREIHLHHMPRSAQIPGRAEARRSAPDRRAGQQDVPGLPPVRPAVPRPGTGQGTRRISNARTTGCRTSSCTGRPFGASNAIHRYRR